MNQTDIKNLNPFSGNLMNCPCQVSIMRKYLTNENFLQLIFSFPSASKLQTARKKQIV